MKITVLGSGTSTGNPEIGCTCEVCTSTDKRDWRMRTSILVETQGKHLLIDCGPDFRWQMLRSKTTQLDAVLISHEHYDHVGGLDDLRPFCRKQDMAIYAEERVCHSIITRMPYAFRENSYPGIPKFSMHSIGLDSLQVQGIDVQPIRLYHGKLPIVGYRIGDMVFLTDFTSIPESEYDKLKNVKVLILDALRDEPHISHQTVAEALTQIERIQPERSYFIHMSHHFGLHEQREKLLPEGVYIAYDTLEITV